MTIKSDFCRAPDCTRLRDKKQGSSLCVMHRVRRSRYKSFDIPLRPGLPEGIAMICINHGERTINQVYKSGTKYNRCLECKKISYQKHIKNNPNKRMTRNFYFVGKPPNRIKISKIHYDELFKQQNGLCKICNKPETMKHNNKNAKRLAVDHKKGTEKIRGLLCQNCNVGIGNLGDSIELLKSAIKYLEESNTD